MRLLPLLALSGCGVEAAPADLDGLTHWLWAHYDDADDAEVAEAIDALHVALDGDALDALTGELTDLSPEELAPVGLDGVYDTAAARGWVLGHAYACTLGALEPILTAQDQDVLYPGVYEAYDRRYTSDADAFHAGDTDTLGWEVDIEAVILGKAYSEHINGGVRRVTVGERPALLARTWLPEPAVFEDPDFSFEQDVQLEAWYERRPGEVVHLYGIWRHMVLGGLSTDTDGVVTTTLNNMEDWDDHTEALCAGG